MKEDKNNYNRPPTGPPGEIPQSKPRPKPMTATDSSTDSSADSSADKLIESILGPRPETNNLAQRHYDQQGANLRKLFESSGDALGPVVDFIRGYCSDDPLAMVSAERIIAESEARVAVIEARVEELEAEPAHTLYKIQCVTLMLVEAKHAALIDELLEAVTEIDVALELVSQPDDPELHLDDAQDLTTKLLRKLEEAGNG